MYACRDTRTGKFLRGFSGSFNDFRWRAECRLRNGLERGPTEQELHAYMWCLDTPDEAKTYKVKGAIANSFYSYRYRRNQHGFQGRAWGLIPLEEAMPWLQVVEVKLRLVCVEAAA